MTAYVVVCNQCGGDVSDEMKYRSKAMNARARHEIRTLHHAAVVLRAQEARAAAAKEGNA